MLEVIETCQPSDVHNRPEALHPALRLLTRFMLETLHNTLRNIHLYDVVDENILKMSAVKKYKVPTVGLRMLLTEFNASAGADLPPQFPTVPGRSTAIPDAKENSAGEVEVLVNE